MIYTNKNRLKTFTYTLQVRHTKAFSHQFMSLTHIQNAFTLSINKIYSSLILSNLTNSIQAPFSSNTLYYFDEFDLKINWEWEIFGRQRKFHDGSPFTFFLFLEFFFMYIFGCSGTNLRTLFCKLKAISVKYAHTEKNYCG